MGGVAGPCMASSPVCGRGALVFGFYEFGGRSGLFVGSERFRWGSCQAAWPGLVSEASNERRSSGRAGEPVHGDCGRARGECKWADERASGRAGVWRIGASEHVASERAAVGGEQAGEQARGESMRARARRMCGRAVEWRASGRARGGCERACGGYERAAVERAGGEPRSNRRRSARVRCEGRSSAAPLGRIVGAALGCAARAAVPLGCGPARNRRIMLVTRPGGPWPRGGMALKLPEGKLRGGIQRFGAGRGQAARAGEVSQGWSARVRGEWRMRMGGRVCERACGGSM